MSTHPASSGRPEIPSGSIADAHRPQHEDHDRRWRRRADRLADMRAKRRARKRANATPTETASGRALVED